MTKFNEKSLTGYPMAFYFTAMQTFDNRMAGIETELTRLLQMAAEHHRLFQAFDTAYKNSLKNQLSDTIK